MKTYKILTAVGCALALSSCVSMKKFKAVQSDYLQMKNDNNNCQNEFQKEVALANDLDKQKGNLQAQIDYLKKNNTQMLSALQDMSVLSSNQAESVKQSLADIARLQSAIAKKDSINLALVTNLKSAVGQNDTDINIKVEKGVVYIDISDKMLFNSGKYDVTPQAKVVLGKVAKVLNAYPKLDVMVEGNTDSIPIHTGILYDNWDLSVKRATSVVRILQEQYNIDPGRLTAAGCGKFNPVASNSYIGGRALNRRTTIIILPELDQFFKLLVKN